MNSGDNSARKENLQRKGQPQALRAMIQSSASTYASVLNATLFPFLLYQQSLVIATRVTLGSLQAATGVAQRRIEAGDETHRQDTGPIGQAIQGNVELSGRVAFQQNVEVAGETVQESGVETSEWAPSRVDEVASGLSEPMPPPPEAPEAPSTVNELSSSLAPEVRDETATEVFVETDQGGGETSNQPDRESDEAHLSPSARVLPPSHEEPATAEDRPPAQEEEASTDEPITQELPPPPEVPDIELHPPPPVPQSILDELPPPPVPEVSNLIEENEPTTSPKQGEKARVRVRMTTAAARRRPKTP